MSQRFIRLPEVMKITSKSRSAIYADMAIGLFPKAHLIGKRSIAWLESDVFAWMDARVKGDRP